MTPTVCAYKHASARHACCTHTMHAHTETQDSRQLAIPLRMHRPVHNLSSCTLKRLRQKDYVQGQSVQTSETVTKRGKGGLEP